MMDVKKEVEKILLQHPVVGYCVRHQEYDMITTIDETKDFIIALLSAVKEEILSHIPPAKNYDQYKDGIDDGLDKASQIIDNFIKEVKGR